MSELDLKRMPDEHDPQPKQAAPKPAAAAPKPAAAAPKPAAMAPKPAAKGSAPLRRPEPRVTGGVPAAAELLDPHGEPSLEGVDAGTLTAIVGSYVKQIYGDFRQAHREAFAVLVEPPPAPDRSFALQVLEQLVGALATFATGGLASLVFGAVENKVNSDARAALSKSLSSSVSGGITKALTAPAAPGRAPEPGPPSGGEATNPAAATLLAEFESRQEESLREQRGRAERQLLVAGAAMSRAQPGALRPLVEALARHADATSLRAEYIRRVCTGWLQFSSAISLGPRAEGEPAMPGANRIGGADMIAWRRAHAGFIEIEIDFPDEVNGMAGVALGRVSVASGPGAARILRQSGRRLGELPVYRRLWLGSHRLDRVPEVVIGPDHRLEVDAGSSLLAAIAMGARGRLAAVAGEGRGEEAERVRLLDKRARWAPPAAREPGPLGGVVADYPMPGAGDRTEEDERRLVALDTRRHVRAAEAQRGAAALWSWVGAVTTDKIDG